MALWRREGSVIAPVLAEALRNPYYRMKPPRTAGREQFGREYAAKFLAACRKHSKNKTDALATATALTAETIARSYARFVRPRMKGSGVDFLVSGGGVRNGTLMAMLAARLEPMGCEAGRERGVRNARRGQGGGGICAARVANMASAAGKSARGDGSPARRCAGTSYVRLSPPGVDR